MTTAQWIFERAVALMDEGDSRTGGTDIPETRGYKHRTLAILNLLGEECREAAGEPEVWQEITDFESPLSLEDETARGVMPYGLAAHLFLEEDPASASFFQQRYEELLERRRRRRRGEMEDIPLPYGPLAACGEGRRTGWL